MQYTYNTLQAWDAAKESFDDEQNQSRPLVKLNHKPNQFLSVKDCNVIQYIPLDQVIMIKAESNYSTIYILSGNQIFTSKTVKYWIQKIGLEHPDFVRTHRSYLINRNHIKRYIIDTKILVLSNDMYANVARRIKLDL